MKRASLALGLCSTPQSLGVIGRALGIFAAEGVDLHIVREETAGPDGVRGLVSGEYDFAEFGAVPIVQAKLEGHDPLILLAAEPISALYILARCDITTPAMLSGGMVGVLSVAGQTGFSAAKMLQNWHLAGQVGMVPLGTYPRIYKALAEGSIDAGVLTADYRLAGEVAHGFQSLVDLGQVFRFQGPVLATTKRLRERDPDLVSRMVSAYIRTIRLFKTEPDRVVPVLRRHLGFVDEVQTRAIHRFYAERFSELPLASKEGIARIIASFVAQYPNARQLMPEAVYDPSVIEIVAEIAGT
jgi:ABC-type nitrate/sulfonate/bicarbonate transport system substrate-binding protein